MPAIRAIEQVKGGWRVVTTALGSFDILADDIPTSERTKTEAEIAAFVKSRCDARVVQKDGDGKDVLPFAFEVTIEKTADGPVIGLSISDPASSRQQVNPIRGR